MFLFLTFRDNDAVKDFNSAFQLTSRCFLGKLRFQSFSFNWASTVNNSPQRNFALNSGYFFLSTGKTSDSNQKKNFRKCVGVVLLCDAVRWLLIKHEQTIKADSSTQSLLSIKCGNNNLRNSRTCLTLVCDIQAIQSEFTLFIVTLIVFPPFCHLCFLCRVQTLLVV